MPILNYGSSILIVHPMSMYNPAMQAISHVSMELAVWLSLKREETSLLQNHEDITRIRRFQSLNFIEPLILRAVVAGAKGYRPPLSTPTGFITPIGLQLSDLLEPVYQEILSETNHKPRKPYAWDKAEDCFIHLELRIRAAKMLQLLAYAIDAAEQKDTRRRQKLDEENKTGNKSQDRPPVATRPEGSQIPQNTQNWTSSQEYDKSPQAPQSTEQLDSEKFLGVDLGITHPSATLEQRTTEQQNDQQDSTESTESEPLFTNLLTYTQVAQNVQMPQSETFVPNVFHVATDVWEGWVPTSTFAQNTRNDLTQLLKYGLVDMRAWHTGGRGRARHVIRPSTIGRILLKDLEKEGII